MTRTTLELSPSPEIRICASVNYKSTSGLLGYRVSSLKLLEVFCLPCDSTQKRKTKNLDTAPAECQQGEAA